MKGPKILLTLIVISHILYGTTVTVNTTADSGPGSFRESVNSSSAGDTIRFDSSIFWDTIFVSSKIDITKEVAIIGPGSDKLTLSGSGVTRILDLKSSSKPIIKGLTFVDGRAQKGGAIRSTGPKRVTIRNCVFRDNHAFQQGGAIGLVKSGRYNIFDCTFQNNSSGDAGGGLSHDNYGIGSVMRINIEGCFFANNTAVRGGGLFYNSSGGPLTKSVISRSTFSENVAIEGGGIWISVSSGSQVELQMSTLTISQNNATMEGGGIYFYHNTINAVEMNLSSSSIVNNSCTNGTGGMFHDFARAATGVGLGDFPLSVANCIIAANSSLIDSNLSDIGYVDYGLYGPLQSEGNNIFGVVPNVGSYLISRMLASGDLIGTAEAPLDPKCLPLADNGGRVPTHALDCGSPAINGGVVNFFTLDSLDARGLSVFGLRPDIGAFEIQLSCIGGCPSPDLPVTHVPYSTTFFGIQVNWSTIIGSEGCRVYYRPQGSSSFEFTDLLSQEVNTYSMPTTLIPGTTYEWGVNCSCTAGGATGITQGESFTVPGGSPRMSSTQDDLLIYPNPLGRERKLILQTSSFDFKDAVHFLLTNAMGEEIMSGELHAGDMTNVRIDLPKELKAGCYILTVEGKSNFISRIIAVQ